MKIKLFIASALLTLTSCATIISTSKQSIIFNSSPTEANVYINSEEAGKTPLTKSLDRKGEYQIKITLDGYYPYETKLSRKINGWFFGNILLGGLIGIIVDASTGAMYQLTPEQLNAALKNKGNAIIKSDTNDKLFVMATLNANPSWKKIDSLGQIQ